MGHQLGAVQKADSRSKGGIYDVEERFLHPIDRALTLLLLDRENFGSMIQSGWRVGGLVTLLVASLRRGGEKVLMPWGWRPERQRGLRLYLRSRRLRVLPLRSTRLQLPLWLVLSRLRPYSRS